MPVCRDCRDEVEIGEKYCQACKVEHGVPDGFSVEEGEYEEDEQEDEE